MTRFKIKHFLSDVFRIDPKRTTTLCGGHGKKEEPYRDISAAVPCMGGDVHTAGDAQGGLRLRCIATLPHRVFLAFNDL